MLEIIRGGIGRRQWQHFLLTGDTEEHGALVQNFQQAEAAAVFLISLRAGGFGLNLTAASYVVYDFHSDAAGTAAGARSRGAPAPCL